MPIGDDPRNNQGDTERVSPEASNDDTAGQNKNATNSNQRPSGWEWWRWFCTDWQALNLHEKSQLIFTAIGAIIAITGVCILIGQNRILSQQSEIMRRQSDLMRDQLRGSQAAVMEVSFGLGDEGVRLGFINLGHVIAKNFEVHFVATREALPSRQQIGGATTHNVSPRDIPAIESPQSSGTLFFGLPNFGTTEWQAVIRTEQSVTVNGTFQYEDGFGEIIKGDFCRSFLWYTRPGGDLASNNFLTCDDFPNVLGNYLRQEQEQKTKGN